MQSPSFASPSVLTTFCPSRLPQVTSLLRRPSTAPCPCKRRSRLPVSAHAADGAAAPDWQQGDKGEVTCGDAFREWIVARDRGEAPRDKTACASGRVDVLFVGRDNSTTSVAAEAIFTDLCARRQLSCFASHSVGTKVQREGEGPDWRFIEALRIKRGLDVSRKLACKLDKGDLESYSLIVCMDEHTRSELLYMVADEEGRFSEEQEERIVVLSAYCSEPKLKSMQFRAGSYSRDAMNFLIAALVDACNGLLASLIEELPMPQT